LVTELGLSVVVVAPVSAVPVRGFVTELGWFEDPVVAPVSGRTVGLVLVVAGTSVVPGSLSLPHAVAPNRRATAVAAVMARVNLGDGRCMSCSSGGRPRRYPVMRHSIPGVLYKAGEVF
jgi:hypothetical protein